MKVFKLSSLALAGAVVVAFAAACDSTNVPQEVSDATINNDIASSSGDAMASSVNLMIANEQSSALAIKAPAPMSSVTGNSQDVAYTRTRTCFNASDVVVPSCSPMSSIRKIVWHATGSGSRSGTSTTSTGSAINWTGAAHRVVDDTLLRNFSTAQPPVEQSRTHNAVGVAHDTATFTDADAGATRVVSEDAADSVQAVTWNLPHTSNPWPVSGKLKRVDNVHVVATADNQTFTRDVNFTIEVDFPPDAQGNVVLKVNNKICNLNLVTHQVTECH